MSIEGLKKEKYYDVDVETWIIPGKVRIFRAAMNAYGGQLVVKPSATGLSLIVKGKLIASKDYDRVLTMDEGPELDSAGGCIKS